MMRAAIVSALRRVPLARAARMVALASLAAALISAAQIRASAQSSAVDTATSRRLTDYLRKHRLPLVGGQVTRDDAGGTLVMIPVLLSPLRRLRHPAEVGALA